MSYQPVVPFSGYAGWAFLERTKEQQLETFSASSVVTNITENFREKIAEVETVEDLMADRQLRQVAFGAFGLDDDVDSIFFMQKVMSEDLEDDDALANKLTNDAYADLSEAFGFGDPAGNKLSEEGFADQIIAQYQERQFEIAVGNQDETMRLALTMQRELGDIATSDNSDDGRWYSVMGNAPIRSVMETALGLPSSIGTLDLDLQLTQFRQKTENFFDGGEVGQFASQESRDELLRLYVARAEVNSGFTGNSSASNALILLSG